MPRGEQKNLKYIKEQEWIKINISGEEESFRIKNYEFDTRTLKTEYVHRNHWDSYPRGFGEKKKVYPSESGLRSTYTVTYPLGNHDLWTKHYLEASKLSTEIGYLKDDIEEKERVINSYKKWWKVIRVIQRLETENKDKIETLCEERNRQELVYEKIISYEIPVRHRVFRSPYTLETDKYGIGPFDKSSKDKKYWCLNNRHEVFYSMNPQESIELIRNDKERIERLESFRHEIHDHQGRVNQLENVISGGGYREGGYSVEYDKIGDLKYFKNDISLTINYDDDEYSISCAKSLILNTKAEYDELVSELNSLIQLKEKKEKVLRHISSQSYLDKLYNEVNRVSKRREKIERLQSKRERLNRDRERKEAERIRQEKINKQNMERARLREEARVKREKELKEDMENYILMLKGSRHGHGHKDSEGNEKTWYETKEEAIADALKLAKKKDRLLNPYYVMLETPTGQKVKGWFLTSVADKKVS